jgi:thiamine monophosphate synthase
MGYFTYRTHDPARSASYTRRNLALLREATGNAALPVHVIGGLARDASPAQVREFVEAARAGQAVGSSLYDFADTSARQWLLLRASND